LTHTRRKATTSTDTASLKLNRDPLGSQFLSDSADAALTVFGHLVGGDLALINDSPGQSRCAILRA
jgi:hypothetical protein